MIIEVVASSDESSDRLRVCRGLPTLRQYALVREEAPSIAVHGRLGSAWSRPRNIEGLDASLELSALDVTIPLAEIYRDVLSA